MNEDVHIEYTARDTRYPPPRKIHYPESNGLPLAETRFQYDSLTYAAGALDIHFRDRPDVSVEGNRLLYYVEGEPRFSVAPDVFVVIGAPKRRRRTYLLWEEPKGPDFVLEVTSWSTRRRDQVFKRNLYARLGVSEYWLFDPTGDWLDPPLQGNRLVGGDYEPMAPIGIEGGERVLRSTVLGLEVYVDGDEIRFRDPETGRKLPTMEESERDREESDRAGKEFERKWKESDRAGREFERKWKESDRAGKESERKWKEAERAGKESERKWKESERALAESERALKDARARNVELEALLRDARSSVPPRRP